MKYLYDELLFPYDEDQSSNVTDFTDFTDFSDFSDLPDVTSEKLTPLNTEQEEEKKDEDFFKSCDLLMNSLVSADYDFLFDNLRAQLKNKASDAIIETLENNSDCLKIIASVFSLSQLVELFLCLLVNKKDKKDKIINLMWDHNKEFTSYFIGNPVQVIDEQGQICIVKLSSSELIAHFNAALTSRCSVVILSMWNKSSFLKDEIKKCNNQDVMRLINEALPTVRKRNSKFLANFLPWISKEHKPALEACLQEKLLITKQTKSVIAQINVLKQYLNMSETFDSVFPYSNVAVRNTPVSYLPPPERPLGEVLAHFRLVLAASYSMTITGHEARETMMLIWHNSPRFASYYSGETIRVINEQAEMETFQLPFQEVIAHFKLLLASHCVSVIKSMLEKNPKLLCYHSGESVELVNKEGEVETIQLSISELVADFKLVLASCSADLITFMWTINPQLASYYSGEPIRIIIEENEIQIIQLSILELIDHFKLALRSRCSDVINAMWENKNTLLQYNIQRLDSEQLMAVIDCALLSPHSGTSEFITKFLNSLSNRTILEDLLENKFFKSPFKKQLMNRLRQIDDGDSTDPNKENKTVPSELLKHAANHNTFFHQKRPHDSLEESPNKYQRKILGNTR